MICIKLRKKSTRRILFLRVLCAIKMSSPETQPFRLSSTATATATVAPTMGLLPMPRKPYIALSYCLVFLALLSFSYSQFSFASLYVDKVRTRICPQSNLKYLYNIILLHNYKTQQKYLSAILESYRLFFSSLL